MMVVYFTPFTDRWSRRSASRDRFFVLICNE